MKSTLIGLVWCCLLLSSGAAVAQQYFKLFEKLKIPYEQKIARFSNGDMLIVGSPVTGETSDQNGGVNLTRLDQCGNVRWASNYQWKKNYMKFKDVLINDANEIFVYGTAYESPNSEFIFLLKLNKNGGLLGFKVFHGGAVDNFTYNIVLKDNRLMIYGLLLDWNTPKQGFLAVFDDNLNYQWAKIFEPFESVGHAIITKDNGFLCRSGFYLVKLNAQGNLQWAQLFDSESGFYPTAGPITVEDGYVFVAIQEQHAFLYKIDEKGEIRWKSDQFSATNNGVDITLLPDDNLLVSYNCPGVGENFPCQLLLSPDGKILQQKKLITDQSLQTASIYHSIGKNRIANIIGSGDVQTINTGKPSGFLLQYSLDSLSGKCFSWKPFQNLIPNNAIIKFSPLDITFFEPEFRNIEASIIRGSRKFSFTESCSLHNESIIQIDTLLKCEANWQVSLPGPNFQWEDENPSQTRLLEQPGTYRASDNNCISPTIYEFTLEKEPCQCSVFLPTAFSPNYDGQNDRLELFSSCIIEQIQMTIYNRWGGQVFNNNSSDPTWDGMIQQKPAGEGLYVAVVRYKLVDKTGVTQEGSLVQNVQLIR